MAEGSGLVLRLGEGGAATRLYLQAHALGFGLLLFEHARDILAGAVAGFLHFYEAGVAVFLGALDIHQERVYALLAGQLPLALISGELFGHALAGGEVQLVLVGELHVGDVGAEDAHPVVGQLAVQVLLHVPYVAAAQVVGFLRAHLAAALPDRILHRAGEDEVEVRSADDAHEGERVHYPELQEEFYRLERHVLLRRADGYRREVRDLRRRVDDELDPVPRPPEVVPSRREGAFDLPVARAHAGRSLLYLDDGAPPQPKQREAEQEQPAVAPAVLRYDDGYDLALVPTPQVLPYPRPARDDLFDPGELLRPGDGLRLKPRLQRLGHHRSSPSPSWPIRSTRSRTASSVTDCRISSTLSAFSSSTCCGSGLVAWPSERLSSSAARSRIRACISSILSLIACMSSGVNRGSPPVPIIRREISRKSTASSPSMAPICTTCGSLSATAASLSRTSCWKRYSRI